VLHPIFQRVLLQIAPAFDQRQPEIGGADVRLQAVLLEEHPLQRLGAMDAVLRRQHGAAGDVPENGIRLGNVAAGCDLEQRDLSTRIFGEEFGRAAFAFENVGLDQHVGNAEPGQREADLVAIAGALIRIERVHVSPESQCARTVRAKSGNCVAFILQARHRGVTKLRAGRHRKSTAAMNRIILFYSAGRRCAGWANRPYSAMSVLARCSNTANVKTITGTASGISVNCATSRATSGTSQSAASAVFS